MTPTCTHRIRSRTPLAGLSRWTTAAVVAISLSLVQPHAANAEQPADSLVKSYNRSGLELFGKLAVQPGNLVISPFSIGVAMTMARAGARADTNAEMASVLKQELPRAALGEASQQLTAAVTKRGDGEDASIQLANALHLTKFGDLVAPSYKALLAEKFDAELFSGSDLAAINDWVKQRTHGKIERILSKLDPYSVCVLLNAVYFKSNWAAPFLASVTAPGEFRLSERESVEVPMMRQSGYFRILRAHTFDAIELPYQGDKLSMIVLLPMRLTDNGRVAIGFDNRTVTAVLDGLAKTRPNYVELHMPKFKTEFGANLIPAFSDLGMALAFDQDHADFRGITESDKEEDRIHISQIQHKAFIDVNEAGAEAAAATAVEFAARSGAILFAGRLSDPRQ